MREVDENESGGEESEELEEEDFQDFEDELGEVDEDDTDMKPHYNFLNYKKKLAQ